MALYRDRAGEKGILLRRDIAPTVPAELWGDAVRLGRLLSVLLSNAVKFTERGEVCLLIEPAPQMEGVRSGSVSNGGRVRFSVTDTGIGIGPADAQRVFQPFVQADGSYHRQYGGTGLGLALARQLVELMGGRIDFKSEPGAGSRFWFDLSLARAGDHVSEPAKKPGCALVYVQEAFSQAVITRTLEKLGYQVLAITMADELGTIGLDLSPTLLVGEIELLATETDWIHVQKLKNGFPRLHVLGLRHDTIADQLSRRFPFRIDGYLEKPLTVEAIRAAVEVGVSASPSR
jgi:hypothetical protein